MVKLAPRHAASELSNLDLCLFSFMADASGAKFVFRQYIIHRKLIISAFTQGYALAVNMSLKKMVDVRQTCKSPTARDFCEGVKEARNVLAQE